MARALGKCIQGSSTSVLWREVGSPDLPLRTKPQIEADSILVVEAGNLETPELEGDGLGDFIALPNVATLEVPQEGCLDTDCHEMVPKDVPRELRAGVRNGTGFSAPATHQAAELGFNAAKSDRQGLEAAPARKRLRKAGEVDAAVAMATAALAGPTQQQQAALLHQPAQQGQGKPAVWAGTTPQPLGLAERGSTVAVPGMPGARLESSAGVATATAAVRQAGQEEQPSKEALATERRRDRAEGEAEEEEQEDQAEDGDDSGGDQDGSDDDDDDGGDEEALQDFKEANDTQCPQCDDGGDLISCDGPCMRAFHFGYCKEENDDGAEVETWGDGLCNPLRIPRDLGQLLIGTNQNDQFLCPNCLSNRHQCFKCKKEGDANRDLFRCMAASCGKFYHAKCAGVQQGQPILCPLHTCRMCKQRGDSANKGELVPCRRCPTAYHRHCLPSSLTQSAMQRVWLSKLDEHGQLAEDTEGTRSLIYCNEHRVRGGDLGVDHKSPLFEAGLLDRWRAHYAELYPHLPSSAAILAEAKRRMEESGSDLEDVPLAKRVEHATTFQRRPAGVIPPLASPMRAPAPLPGTGMVPSPIKSTGALASPAKSAPSARGAKEGGAEEAGEAPPWEGSEGTVPGDEAEGKPGGIGGEEEGGDTEEELPFPLLSVQEARKRAEAQLRAVEHLVTLNSLRQETRQPAPYRGAMKKTIDEDRLQGLEKSLRYAWDQSRKHNLSAHDLGMLVDRNSTQEVNVRHDDLMMVLAPYLHGDRYSSYGRHFTDLRLLEAIVNRMRIFMRDGDQVVDFSCGANHWVPMVRRKCLEDGMVVAGRAYDIILAKDLMDFRLQSWFDTTPQTEDLAPPPRLVIGLNPPFGKNNVLADKFVWRAADFCPRLIVLIVPPGTVVPHGYRILYENRRLCKGEEFYVPGSDKRSWNKEVPAFRIMVREEFYQETVMLCNSEDWVPIPLHIPAADLPTALAMAAQQQQQQQQALPMQRHPAAAMAGMQYVDGEMQQFAMAAAAAEQQQGMDAFGFGGPMVGGMGGLLGVGGVVVMDPRIAPLLRQQHAAMGQMQGGPPGGIQRHVSAPPHIMMQRHEGTSAMRFPPMPDCQPPLPAGFDGSVPPGFDGMARGPAYADRPLWAGSEPRPDPRGAWQGGERPPTWGEGEPSQAAWAVLIAR